MLIRNQTQTPAITKPRHVVLPNLSRFVIPKLKSSGGDHHPLDAKHLPKRIVDKLLNKRLIDLCICEPVIGTCDDVGHPHVLPFVFAVFPESFPGNHDWHR